MVKIRNPEYLTPDTLEFATCEMDCIELYAEVTGFETVMGRWLFNICIRACEEEAAKVQLEARGDAAGVMLAMIFGLTFALLCAMSLCIYMYRAFNWVYTVIWHCCGGRTGVTEREEEMDTQSDFHSLT